ncbi:BMC domain-containing protein [Lonepinella koalarum]|uniref:BMC domain-containing protein n=1 Tax=Lonepinella koalarum TaxID=53417 RepID=A0A4V2PTL0_9PAST|nr:BMC domain-containing protein [Lonepinella koalarum]MDH2926657.1 hypothetical protein [Lonepinella koalarum]TCK66981.1 BMC domain-containing protein [Lonepinella koalarum]TFJ88950.1 BMC domain-containing protein [Lonepinella koalarum]
MKRRIINAPSQDVIRMMRKHMSTDGRAMLENCDIHSVALMMLSIPELYYYADIATKNANVVVTEIFGTCPQHVTTLAIWGEVAAVRTAVEAIEEAENME